MKATDLLKKQHRKVEAIFKKLEHGRGDKAPLVIELANNLAGHMAIEQDIFYPAVVKVDRDLISEGYEEHSLAELAVKRLLETDPDDAAFKARVVAAKELIEHHVEEEEDDMFKKVEKAFDDDALEELGKAMKRRFEEVYKAGYESVVPRGFAKTSADVARGKLRADDRKKEAAASKKRAA